MNTHRPYGCRENPEMPAGPMAPDLTRATTFAYPTAEQVRAVGADEQPGDFYPRYGHPNGRLFEQKMAALEEADGAVAFASGLAALHAVFCGLLGKGDAIAVSHYVYGGVEAMLTEDLPRFGVKVWRFDPFEEDSLAQVLEEGVKLVHVETPTNPLCRVVNIPGLAELVRPAGALLSVDATFVPPPFQRPLAGGADLVIHSATKILGGHSDAQGGVVSGRHELLERLESFRRRSGGILSPDTAWLLARSLATLDLRMRKAAENAFLLAQYLDNCREQGGKVEQVHYPGLPGHPDHETALAFMETFGFMVGVKIEGGLPAAVEVYDRFRVIARAVSLGGVETLASLPLHTSHATMTAEARERAGIVDGLIRLSVGIEPYEMLEADLANALGL